MQPRKIQTIGDLRDVLCQSIEAVIAGTMEPATAKSVVALAAQVNNSLLAEVESARFTMAADKTYTALGKLPVGVPVGDVTPLKQIEGAGE